MNHPPTSAGQPDVAQYKLDTLQRVVTAQNELIHRLATLKRSATSKLVLKSILLDIVQIANRLTAAEEGSIFMLNAQGVVTESILARGPILRDLKRDLIGQVLDHGLAGWVMQHQRLGLVDDTDTDPRWTPLPGQTFAVKSALCIPLMKGRQILGLLTLMHAQPQHFRTIAAQSFSEVMAAPLALLLENAQLHDQQLLQEHGALPGQAAPVDGRPATELIPAAAGIYILRVNGQLQYANPPMTEIFGYNLAELVEIESIVKLFTPADQPKITAMFKSCFAGQERAFALTCRGMHRSQGELPLYLEGNVTKLSGSSVIVGTLRHLE